MPFKQGIKIDVARNNHQDWLLMESEPLSKQFEGLPAYGLRLELKSVPVLISGIYTFFFLLVLIACYLSDLPYVLPVGVLFIMAYAPLLFRKNLLRTHPLAIKRLVFTELGWCYIELNNAHVFKADINTDSILTEHLVILNLLKNSEKSSFLPFIDHYSVLLTASEVGSDKFRQMKRHLQLINFSKKK